MVWHIPLPLRLIESADGGSFRHMAADSTALPLAPHPGSFAFIRKNHVHEGVDLYCPQGTPVSAVEDGQVVACLPFTGLFAGSPWWHDTYAVLVEGQSGVVVYGEIMPVKMMLNMAVKTGDNLGHVKQVLKEDKGRPMSMLHLELHEAGTRDVYEWKTPDKRPKSLLDPTPFLRAIL